MEENHSGGKWQVEIYGLSQHKVIDYSGAEVIDYSGAKVHSTSGNERLPAARAVWNMDPLLLGRFGYFYRAAFVNFLPQMFCDFFRRGKIKASQFGARSMAATLCSFTLSNTHIKLRSYISDAFKIRGFRNKNAAHYNIYKFKTGGLNQSEEWKLISEQLSYSRLSLLDWIPVMAHWIVLKGSKCAMKCLNVELDQPISHCISQHAFALTGVHSEWSAADNSIRLIAGTYITISH